MIVPQEDDASATLLSGYDYDKHYPQAMPGLVPPFTCLMHEMANVKLSRVKASVIGSALANHGPLDVEAVGIRRPRRPRRRLQRLGAATIGAKK